MSEPATIELTLNGQNVTVAGLTVQGREVIVSGKLAKIARIRDEEWLQGPLITDVPEFLATLQRSLLRCDWFTFAQHFTDIKPRLPYRFEWDNIAAVPLIDYDDWWTKRVSHDLRKDVKRAEKRGVEVRVVPFDDSLANGIAGIYNETAIRQGRKFWHFGKSVDQVRSENATYLERSTFIGAFIEDTLIGFIKLVQVDEVARMMQILAMEQHQDKRPMNALIAKAVEVACSNGSSYLTYGRFTYDNKKNSSIVQFKRRNGFEEILFPRYFIPFSVVGKCSIALGLHLGVKRLIPERLTYLLLDARSRMTGHYKRESVGKAQEGLPSPQPND